MMESGWTKRRSEIRKMAKEYAESAGASQNPKDPFPRPWTRGASTTDGEPIYDANGELVMMVRSAFGYDEPLQKLIVEAVNAFNE